MSTSAFARELVSGLGGLGIAKAIGSVTTGAAVNGVNVDATGLGEAVSFLVHAASLASVTGLTIAIQAKKKTEADSAFADIFSLGHADDTDLLPGGALDGGLISFTVPVRDEKSVFRIVYRDLAGANIAGTVAYYTINNPKYRPGPFKDKAWSTFYPSEAA